MEITRPLIPYVDRWDRRVGMWASIKRYRYRYVNIRQFMEDAQGNESI